MSKRAILNLLLLVFITILAAFLVFTDRDVATPAMVTVSTIDPNSIQQISVSRAGQVELQFSKRADGWYMQSPLSAPANNTRIKAMLAILKARSHAELPVTGLDPDQFGIRNPVVTLRLNEHEFRFGGPGPLDDRRYLLYQDRLHLINDGLFQQLQQKPEFFIMEQKN